MYKIQIISLYNGYQTSHKTKPYSCDLKRIQSWVKSLNHQLEFLIDFKLHRMMAIEGVPKYFPYKL